MIRTKNSVPELFADQAVTGRPRKIAYHHRNRKPLSEETKAKIRQTLTGKKKDPQHVQHISESLKGITRDETTRQKMSEAKIGPRHPNWKGGISLPDPNRKRRVKAIRIPKRIPKPPKQDKPFTVPDFTRKREPLLTKPYFRRNLPSRETEFGSLDDILVK